MKISAATAKAAIAGTAPPDMDEYGEIGDYVSKNGSPLTLGRAGCFIALGSRLKNDKVEIGDESVDISRYKEVITAEEAFSFLRNLAKD